MRNGTGSRLWLLLLALFALAWFWPVLSHGFRSDDFLTVYYLDRETEAVRWGRVFEEWARPWFGVRDLYRPVVSLTYGVNWACGTSSFGFHLFNLLLLLGTATCVAGTAARLVSRRKNLVGLVAGLLVVLHPAAVEPAAWIAARTTGLQVFFSALAYWSFLRWRDGDGRWWLPWLATALACASKEGAVLLPFSLVAVDLLRGGRPSWRTHAPFFALVAGYMVFRKALLGWFSTAEEGHTIWGRLEGAAELFGQLTVPPLGNGYYLGGFLFLCLYLFVGQSLWAAGSRRALWCLPWAFGLLTPGTTHLGAAADALAGRFVFDAVPALALFVAIACARFPASRFERFRAGLGLLGIAVGLGIASHVWLARYDAQARTIDEVQQELLAHAADAAPGRPYGVVGLPGQPLLQPALWGFLTLRPFVARDVSVVGLAHVLTRTPKVEAVFADATPIHALVTDGAGCGVWDDRRRRLVAVAGAEQAVVELVRDGEDSRRFLPPRRLPPTAVAGIEIASPTPVARWRAEVLGNLQGDFAAAPMEVESNAGGTRAWLGCEHLLPWLVAATLGGGPAGIALQADGTAPPPGTRVRAHPAAERLSTPPPLAEPIDRGELAGAIARPDDRRGYLLYLLLPTGVYAQPVVPGRALEITVEIGEQVAYACDILGTCPAHWCLVEDPALAGERPRRTAFGSVTLR